jgi:hypothetical protein
LATVHGTPAALGDAVASIQHEAPLLLLGERPELLVHLLRRRLGLRVGPNARVALGNAEFTQAVPLERRADAVVTIEEDGKITSAFVVEVQLAKDEEKHFSWPLYAATLHARVRCPTSLVVFAPTTDVADWARTPISTLQPTRPFAPLVLGPREIPRVTSEEAACRMPELAILSALVHGHEPDGEAVVRHAIVAAGQLDDQRTRTYYDLLYSSLGDVARVALEALMSLKNYEYKSDFAKKYVAEGRNEGRAEGRNEGRAEGRNEGRAEGRNEGRAEEARDILLALIATRKLGPSEAARARIHACADRGTLERWILRVAAADAEDDVFAPAGS